MPPKTQQDKYDFRKRKLSWYDSLTQLMAKITLYEHQFLDDNLQETAL